MEYRDNYNQIIKGYTGKMYYCIHIPTKGLCKVGDFGGLEFVTNPNQMTFQIKGAWENHLKYREDRDLFEVKEFII
jgi:hypothetical protein